MRSGAACRRRSSSSPSIRCSGGIREKLAGRYETSDHIAGMLSAEWAARLGLRAGIPIPVGALDAHWDAVAANIRLGDVVNVIGTSTCIIGVSAQQTLVPGVCGVVPGSVLPGYTGIEAGLSAVGDIFDGIARRAGTSVAALTEGLEHYRAGQTGLLRTRLGQRRQHRSRQSQSRRRHARLEPRAHRAG